ncbi:unnamed protein product [Euphydryas editha]|uniref:Reverse transcriptase Ty1/copia-type domain-containing protein n=1 Tax=Euphydryas editha TaxID=104508 RepID=A0AAU9USQ4_EUPED|nr:unnamed protein product [Euphydryas editha]
MENIDDSSMTTITVNESRSPEDVKEEEVSLSKEQDTSESQKDKTFIPSNSSSNADDSYSDTLSPEDLDLLSSQCDTNVPEKRVRRKPDFYNVASMCAEISGEQLTTSDVLNSSEKEQWQCAIKDELKSFSENDTWELVDRPKGKTVVKAKWVFKRKFNSDGEVRYRARLVAKGFTQKKGIDFDTFSPVLRYSTFRLLLALSVQLDLKMNHLDVPTAFLNGFLKETVYMEVPECSEFNNCKNKVLRLKRAIYGLKQSARAWYIRVEDCLLKLGYVF